MSAKAGKAAIDFQLAHPCQAAAPSNLQFEQSEWRRGRQTAFGTAGTGDRKPCQPFGFTQQRQQSVVLSKWPDLERKPVQSSISHGLQRCCCRAGPVLRPFKPTRSLNLRGDMVQLDRSRSDVEDDS